eukprot:CAMPEP_0170176482 /NCGR_PEP_ID=MMETSP0040_2-20121228/9356_1 /TAXON_ID=641309 /ORGANISM="Lotharella oceanica, Strain CCMP622" /LENGTH=314 /DNA_ID=CAMNT_0010418825 /DNA_START=69 /DNA_END=1013 /DNA_ORIENTATION=+
MSNPFGGYGPMDRNNGGFIGAGPTRKSYGTDNSAGASSGYGGTSDAGIGSSTNVVPLTNDSTTTTSDVEVGATAEVGQGLTERERMLMRKEEELKRREAKVGLAEREIKALTPNWPCKQYALEYHDIDEEIPPAKRPIMKRLYLNVLLTFAALLINWIAMLGIWFSGDQSGPSYTLWGTMYLLGIPGAWKMWYRPIYFAYRDKATLSYFCFLMSFAAHCFFSVVMALGLPNCAAGGLMTMVQQFAVGNPKAGFMTFLSMLAWIGVAGLSILNIKKVQNEWGKEGVDMTSITEQLRNEVRDQLVPQVASAVARRV